MRIRLSLMVLVCIVLVWPTGVAFAQLTNPSFEDSGGSYDGWTIYVVDPDPLALPGYHDPPATGDACGHGLIAPDGTHFAGLTWAYDALNYAQDDVIYYQIYSVTPVVDAVQTNYTFQISVNMAHNKEFTHSRVWQRYRIGWDNAGGTPADPLSPERVYPIARLDHQACANGDQMNWTEWRTFQFSGSIPDTPSVIVLEVRCKNDTDKWCTYHNVFDNVIFSAEQTTEASTGFVGDVANSDFETPPYNTTYPDVGPRVLPTGWEGYGGLDKDGPAEGYTNGSTTPTDPLGVSTTDGTHFFGRAKPVGVLKQFHVWIGQIVPVRDYSPAAYGLKYKLHVLSSASQEFITDSYDHCGQEWEMLWMPDGSEPPGVDINVPWVWMANPSVRTTNNDTSGFIPVDVSGQLNTYDVNGDSLPVQYVVLRCHLLGWGESDVHLYRTMIDKVDFSVEALGGNNPYVIDEDPDRGTQVISLSQIEVTFNESVTGVTADDLTVNGSPATNVTGTGAGPYIFTGYPAPGLGTVNVVLAAGGIEDGESNPFAGDSWTYELITPPDICDFDWDGDVDMADLTTISNCYAGPGGGIKDPGPEGEDCSRADVDADLDVDLIDFATFQAHFTG